jgi:hydrogenase maturation protease
MDRSAAPIACNGPRDSDTPAAKPEHILVLGIGNVLWADEGFGVRCVEALQARWQFAPHVTLMDGGTQGLYLIPHVNAATRLLILDAIDYGLVPGTLKVVENDEVPKFLGAKKMSLHQTGFQEVLALSQLTGDYPDEVLLIGCQPAELEDYGGSLRPIVKQAMETALDLAVQRLASWGAEPVARTAPVSPDEAVTSPELALAVYESQRPSADAACRVGDQRFMASLGVPSASATAG